MKIRVFKSLSAKERELLKSGVIEVSGKSMGRSALGVVAALVKLYPDSTLDDLKAMLPDDLNPNAPVQFKSPFRPFTNLPLGVFKPVSIQKEYKDFNFAATHFTGPDEIITTGKGEKIMVSRLWSKDSFQKLVNHVAQFGVKVVDFKEGRPFQRGEYQLEIINPKVFKDLSESHAKISQPVLIGGGIALAGLIALLLKLLLGKGVDVNVNVNLNTESNGSKFDTFSLAALKKLERDLEAGVNTEGRSIHFHEILFEYDSDKLLPDATEYLEEVNRLLQEFPQLKLEVVGHTSDEGDELYNLDLSLRRAKAVVKYLIGKGVDSKRLKASGKGEAEPVLPNTSESNRQKNRRIEFIVLDDGIG